MKIEEFIDRLKINRNSIDDELEIQAESQFHIAREVAALSEKVDNLKRDFKIVEADAIARAKEGDPKLTNPMAEKEAQRSTVVRAAFDELTATERTKANWVYLLDAWINRGRNLKALADLHGQQYFSVDSTYNRSAYKAAREARNETTTERSAPPARRRVT